MTVYTNDYPFLRSFMAFLTCGWAARVDFDPTEEGDFLGDQYGS